MTRPMLNQREAATACGVSRTTIRRRREAGALPNAVEDPVRGWLIPVEDLLAAGFRLNAPAPPDAVSVPAGADDDVQEDQEDVAALRAELERARHEHALAVAEAEHGRLLAQAEAEHLREQLAARAEHIADLQQAVRALTAVPDRGVLHPSVPGQQSHPEPAAAPAAPVGPAERGPQRRRRWGGRA
ncbi:helix-turn-helix domain-containing protein [Streptomyces sp. NPDC052069]|uniref:helix-turn-helix transcriptional regulator n=1 Tax=Streptomyces sp. NPDC052069 TaxID=3154650 RepID=UPI0034231DEE